MVKFILWCLTGVFYALSGACLWFAIKSIFIYLHGVTLYGFGVFSLLVMCLSFFLAADWCWQKSKEDL